MYRPGRDGECFLWSLLLETGPLTLEEIEKYRSETEAKVGEEKYIKWCLEAMVKDGAVVKVNHGNFMIDPALQLAVLRIQVEKDKMSTKSKYVEVTPEEIINAAQLTALRTLHKLTGILEQQLEVEGPDLSVVTAFRHAVAAMGEIGVSDLAGGVVSVLRSNE
jgi:hypothetical protein